MYSIALKLYSQQKVGNIMNKSKRMTASELKWNYECASGGIFFTRENMKFLGDTMSNYGVRANTVMIKTYTGDLVECYELYRRKPVKNGVKRSAYFACNDFRHIHGEVQ